MLERTSTIDRYARGLAAALVAVATLVLAANAGPARATEGPPAQSVSDARKTDQAAGSAVRPAPGFLESRRATHGSR